MSSGTRIPAVRNSRIAPIAIWSLPQAMASGSSRRGAARSSRTARWPLMAANRPSKQPSSRTPWYSASVSEKTARRSRASGASGGPAM